MEIKGTNVKVSQEIKEDSQKGKNLAKEIMIFADKNSSAVSKSEFQEKLNKMEKLSTQDLIKFIRSFDKDESIIELICDEIGDDKKVRKEACKKVLNALVNKAKALGIETSEFEKQFTKELDSQFGFLGKYINTDKLDSIINALTQSIENRQNLTDGDLQTIQNTSAEEGANQSNAILENRLEKAYTAFGERVGEDGEMTDVKEYLVNLKTGEKTEVKYQDGQMQRDGLAADIADGVSRIWGSENTAAKVRKDLKASSAQLRQLQEAKLQGEDAYKAKFKEIFGVEYDYANILAYQKAEATYVNASANHEFEMAFNRNLRTLLSPAPLREEVRYDNPDPSTNIVITTVIATKEQVYSREFNNLANFIGKNGAEILNKALEEKGVANGTIEEKFEVLKQITQALSKQLHATTLEAGGGKEFSEVQAMYDNSYKAAYGVENDIMKRVTDYNVSQEKGAGVVKAGVTIAASLAAALSGIGLAGVAAITAGTTVGAEVVDRGTSGKALNALREDGVGAYIKTANDDINWEATLKQAVISGGAVLIGGAVAKGVSIVMEGAKPAAQAIAQFGGDIVCDAGMEYLTTGKITVEGMVFAVLLSAAGNIVAMKQLSAAADAAKSADEAIDGAITQPKVDISAFETKFKAAHSTNELEALVRSAKTVEELDFLISKLDRPHAVNEVIIKSIVDDAINKKNILNGTGSRIVENLVNGHGRIKIYDYDGNLIEKRIIFDGQIDDVIKYSSSGEWLPTRYNMGSLAKLDRAGFTEDVIQNLKAQSDFYGPELVDEVLDMIVYLEDQVAAGKPITKELIEGAIDLYSPGASGGSAYTQRAMIANTWNRGDDVFRAYGQTPPVKATPITPTTSTTDFATKLADVKGPDGKPFLSKADIDNLLKNQADLSGKPIPDFEARIMAVLSNPEEIASLADWKSRAAGVWRAIQEPFQSTVDLNPAAFGVKPKATVPRQTAPSQKLPDVVDKIYGGKAEAEAVVFGNGTLADINPSIVENATEELTKYFGREIKASDLQVVRNSNGAYISYFDPETNLATTFSNSGKLNGQFKIEFDAQGNIQSFDLETIYADGKFWLR